MPNTCPVRLLGGMLSIALVAGVFATATSASGKEISSRRSTPLVEAVRTASPSVVNIQGQKTVADQAAGRNRDATRQVNGMGTGVVIDPRGYILTNHHVVDGVRQINVTFADRRKYIAKIVAFDPRTDLAIIKVRTSQLLPTINIGTSSDLLPAESVVALGNAFGYEHTVTVGIVSALHRDVQVSETQAYDDLIQTDASINPGNSGGPLLNIDGEMIGVNVAVRAGAQGIGFAIPVDAAMEVAARLMSVEEIESKWHGLVLRSEPDTDTLIVERVAAGSPAAIGGLEPGDLIESVGDLETHRRLDLERGMIGLGGQPAELVIERDGEQLALQITPTRLPAASNRASRAIADNRGDAWQLLGLALKNEPSSTFARSKSEYQGGLRITDVRPNSPADRNGIIKGDILVGMHRWQTASMEDVEYIMTRSNLPKLGEVRFYVVRDEETLWTDINVASATTRRRTHR